MKPEKKRVESESESEEFIALGVPAEWVEHLKKMGYTTVEKLKGVDKPGKLHQEMMGYRKKNKLEIGTVTLEQVAVWIE